MPELTPEHNEPILAACREAADPLGESLNRHFDLTGRVEVGELQAWPPEQMPEELGGAGLVVQLLIGEQAVLGILPISLPLPEWCREPTPDQQAGLHELATEWSMLMLPAELQTDRFATAFVPDLQAAVHGGRPADSAVMLPLSLVQDTEQAAAEIDSADEPGESTPEEETERAPQQASAHSEPPGRLWLVWPLTAPPLPVKETPEATAATAPDEAEPPGGSPGTSPVGDSGSEGFSRAENRGTDAAPTGRRSTLLSKLPVTISVRLTEKRIELAQLLSLTPGALITFSKSCDELLDLYVNNHHYCRGEAVKIGEKFGLKINEILSNGPPSGRRR